MVLISVIAPILTGWENLSLKMWVGEVVNGAQKNIRFIEAEKSMA